MHSICDAGKAHCDADLSLLDLQITRTRIASLASELIASKESYLLSGTHVRSYATLIGGPLEHDCTFPNIHTFPSSQLQLFPPVAAETQSTLQADSPTVLACMRGTCGLN